MSRKPIHHGRDAVSNPELKSLRELRQQAAHHFGVLLPEITQHVIAEYRAALAAFRRSHADPQPRILLRLQMLLDAFEPVMPAGTSLGAKTIAADWKLHLVDGDDEILRRRPERTPQIRSQHLTAQV